MKVIILAAGQGTRLRPLTERVPKCMVEINGEPLLHKQLACFESCGIEDITVVSGYLSESIPPGNFKKVWNEQFRETNMVSSLFCCENAFMESSDVIISYGDIVFEPFVLESLINDTSDISVIVDTDWKDYWLDRMDDPLEDAESLVMGVGDRILEIGQKATSYDCIEGQYIGLIKISKESAASVLSEWKKLILRDETDCSSMYMTEFIQHLIDNDFLVRGVKVSRGWTEIDCFKDLEIACSYWNTR